MNGLYHSRVTVRVPYPTMVSIYTLTAHGENQSDVVREALSIGLKKMSKKNGRKASRKQGRGK
jgi:Arc/MetJ-type ribon-helix-helix transcriptional regulator